jgi:hypothetical protein
VNDQGDLAGWVDGPLAVDVVRALRLTALGYPSRTPVAARARAPKGLLPNGGPVQCRPAHRRRRARSVGVQR